MKTRIKTAPVAIATGNNPGTQQSAGRLKKACLHGFSDGGDPVLFCARRPGHVHVRKGRIALSGDASEVPAAHCAAEVHVSHQRAGTGDLAAEKGDRVLSRGKDFREEAAFAQCGISRTKSRPPIRRPLGGVTRIIKLLSSLRSRHWLRPLEALLLQMPSSSTSDRRCSRAAITTTTGTQKRLGPRQIPMARTSRSAGVCE